MSFVVLPEVIDPQAILCLINDSEQLLNEDDLLSRVYQTLKDRVLHPLTIVLATWRSLLRPAASVVLTSYVMRIYMDLGHKEGGVIIDLTSQISGEERRLNVG